MTFYIILNSSGGQGKGAFVNACSKYIKTYYTSIVDPTKDFATCWYGGKTEKDRKFLAEMKSLLDNYCDYNYRLLMKKVRAFPIQGDNIVFIDMREKKDIDRFMNEPYKHKMKVLIRRDSVKDIKSNHADANVYDINYDYIIENNGTLEDLEELAEVFVQEVIDIYRFQTI